MRDLYSVFESFKNNAARKQQPAQVAQMAQSHNLVLKWLENPVY